MLEKGNVLDPYFYHVDLEDAIDVWVHEVPVWERKLDI